MNEFQGLTRTTNKDGIRLELLFSTSEGGPLRSRILSGRIASFAGALSRALLLTISLSLLFSAAPVWSEQDSRKKLDVVLIIDDSGSMKDTDSRQLRVKAAQAFIGYLKLNEDKLDARAGIVLFASGAVLASPLTPVSEDVGIRNSIKVTNQGTTNFPEALKKAYLAFGAFDRPCVYVLLTDGQPESTGKRPDRDQYPKIESWVSRFKEKKENDVKELC